MGDHVSLDMNTVDLDANDVHLDTNDTHLAISGFILYVERRTPGHETPC